MLDVNDYDDFMKVFPKYYDTIHEYNELMQSRYLDPVSKDNFKISKEVHPHIIDKDFDGYLSRIVNYSLSPISESKDFLTLIDNFPRPFEPITTYKKRLPNVLITYNPASMTISYS
ncbi:uncharacterized protein LOC100574091 [Acyrthosiphon pisum]|uniref:Uncharacterized protein n=1 Tax=Acyrthosiphon pisum TaxID=7029 RepID=A0A8R2JPN4_ACYPI|nr:uncharacterized protein LOC100574091 [Acyrthosiphon pisum]